MSAYCDAWEAVAAQGGWLLLAVGILTAVCVCVCVHARLSNSGMSARECACPLNITEGRDFMVLYFF